MLDRLERLALHAVARHTVWIVALTLVHGCGDVVGPAATRASHVSRSMAASPATNPDFSRVLKSGGSKR